MPRPLQRPTNQEIEVHVEQSRRAPGRQLTQTASPADDLDAAQAKIAELEQQLAEANERADRYHANWQRSAADFQNWKRRTDQEKAELARTAEGAMALELLRVLDDFERAFMALPAELRSRPGSRAST